MTKPLIIRHWVACTPAEVWHAWTTPELFHQFISPEGLSVPLESVVMDLHIGGRVAFDMVFDDTGVVNENSGTIEEMEEPNLFVFSEPGMNIRSIQKFTDSDGGTLITVIQEGLPEEIVDNPEVLEAFRSSYRKLGRVIGVATENRDQTL
jgi:uncharacterized protein YndB with AHSA1/START domain